jgi:hypothetical protein
MKTSAMVQLLRLGIALVFAGTAFAAPPPAQTLTMTFSRNAIVIGGVAQSQPIYLFGIAREARGYINRIQSYEARLVDNTGTGAVSFAFDGERSFRSVWVAVDLVSGAAVVGHPAEYPASPMPAPDQRIKKNAGGELVQLSALGTLADFLLVRPGAGIWSQTAGSSGPLDEGKEHGKVTISATSMQPRGGTSDPPPRTLKKGDVVFAVDSFHATYSLTVAGDQP